MIGKVINKYRIDKKLGEGGMGVVYKAWDVDLERPVALKMLHPVFSQDEAFLKRFRAEARALAKLDNRHIVTVYDLQKTEDGLSIVMQYVEGVTLAGKLEKFGPIPAAEALIIFKQLLEALSHAHQARIIHRDVKPSNVMLNQQGIVKVTDFGLAKVPFDSVLTQSRSTGGTLCYMPPEQIRSLANVDQRSDIYSAGMTLYEMLAGRLPFDKHENVYALAQIIVEGDFLPPDHYHSAVPQDLSKIVMKAVAKEPANRHQSVEEMLEAVRNFEAPEETHTLLPPISKPRPGIKMGRLAAAVLSFLVFAALIFFVFHFLTDSASTTLSISTNPHGVAVFLNGDSLGLTPFSAHPARTGRLPLRLKRPNYLTIDTVVVIASGRETKLAFSLQQVVPPAKSDSEIIAPQFGSVQILSQPSEGDIFINEQSRGKTPNTLRDLPVGNYIVVLKKAGYQDFSTSVTVEAGKEKKVDARLAPLMGKLQVVVKPFGSVYIDGMSKTENTSEPYEADLPVGLHRVKIVHPTFGYWEKDIEIKPDSLQAIEVDFNKEVKITVASTPEWAYIYVDDKDTRYQTTQVIHVRVGKHRIEVRREGFVVEPDVIVLNLEDDLAEPLHFTLKEKP